MKSKNALGFRRRFFHVRRYSRMTFGRKRCGTIDSRSSGSGSFRDFNRSRHNSTARWKTTSGEKMPFPFVPRDQPHFRRHRLPFFQETRHLPGVPLRKQEAERFPPEPLGRHPVVGQDDRDAPHAHRLEKPDAGGRDATRTEDEFAPPRRFDIALPESRPMLRGRLGHDRLVLLRRIEKMPAGVVQLREGLSAPVAVPTSPMKL